MRNGRRAPDAMVIVLNLLSLAAVAELSMVSQPEGMLTPPLWPASGIALGLGVCFPRRYLWFLAPAAAVVSLPVLLLAGRPISLALALVAAFAVEMAVGTLLLRGRRDRVPRLSDSSDLVSFLGLLSYRRRSTACSPSAPFRCLGDHAAAMESLQTGVLKHAAGIALLDPDVHHTAAAKSTGRLWRIGGTRCRDAGRHRRGVHRSGRAIGDICHSYRWYGRHFGCRPGCCPCSWSELPVSRPTGAFSVRGPCRSTSGVSRREPSLMQVYQMSMVAVFLTLSIVVGSERDMSTAAARE